MRLHAYMRILRNTQTFSVLTYMYTKTVILYIVVHLPESEMDNGTNVKHVKGHIYIKVEYKCD